MASLPAVLDIRDDLNRARENADEEARAELDDVRERLDALADRDRADREGVLDEVDNRLLRIETRADGETERRIGVARERIRLYRESRDAGEGLSVLESRFRDRSGEDPITEELLGEDARLLVTVVNEGDDREVSVAATFYGPDGDELDAFRADAGFVGGGQQETFELDLRVPSEAEYYTVAATEAGPSA